MERAKPDFSGEWILNREASSLSPGADAMQSATLQIDHREPTFRYKGTFVSASGEVKPEYELQTDGREVTATQPDMSIVSRLAWDGDALVASWLIRRPDGEMSIRFRHELIDGGRRLRASEQVRAPTHDQDNVWIFERRGS
jgi:hypothetical protein